jgi:Tat protein translocase TatB subunit
MFGIGSMELLVILVVALLVFGPQRLPELARMLAKGMRELRRATDDIRSQVEMDEYLDRHPEVLQGEPRAEEAGSPTPTKAATPPAPDGTISHGEDPDMTDSEVGDDDTPA